MAVVTGAPPEGFPAFCARWHRVWTRGLTLVRLQVASFGITTVSQTDSVVPEGSFCYTPGH